MGRNKIKRSAQIIAAVSAAAAGILIGRKILKKLRKDEEKRINAIEDAVVAQRDYGDRRAYLVGGGIASLSCAAYLIRDCGFPGENITVIDGEKEIKASKSDTAGFARAYLQKGNSENLRDLMDSILPLSPHESGVTEETTGIAESDRGAFGARIIDRDGNIVSTARTGLDSCDRIKLLRLFLSKESRLSDMTVEDYFGKEGHFFKTPFWILLSATYAIKENSSLTEFSRFIRRMIRELSDIDNPGDRAGRSLNRYDDIINPLKKYLTDNGVSLKTECEVTDILFADGGAIKATALEIRTQEGDSRIDLKDGDLCIVTIGCGTDSAVTGDTDTPAGQDTGPSMSFELWKRIADKKPGRLGNPEPFFERIPESSAESFSVRLKNKTLLNELEKAGGKAGLTVLKDSPWKLSSFVKEKSYLEDENTDGAVIFGLGLCPERIGDYVKKPMKECTGREILCEYLHQLKFSNELTDELMDTVEEAVPCYMPYMAAAREPRKPDDRPLIIPSGSEDFALIGQFAEQPDDITAFDEYSVRSARTAAYRLMNIQRPIAPVTKHYRNAVTLLRAIVKMIR